MALDLLAEQQILVRTTAIEVGNELHGLIEERIKQIKEGGVIDAKEIASLVSSLRTLDDILRRAAELPSNYKSVGSNENLAASYEL